MRKSAEHHHQDRETLRPHRSNQIYNSLSRLSHNFTFKKIFFVALNEKPISLQNETGSELTNKIDIVKDEKTKTQSHMPADSGEE